MKWSGWSNNNFTFYIKVVEIEFRDKVSVCLEYGLFDVPTKRKASLCMLWIAMLKEKFASDKIYIGLLSTWFYFANVLWGSLISETCPPLNATGVVTSKALWMDIWTLNWKPIALHLPKEQVQLSPNQNMNYIWTLEMFWHSASLLRLFNILHLCLI